VILVKEFLTCIDQLHALQAAYGRKLVFLDHLKQDVVEGTLQHASKTTMSKISSQDQASALARISWAHQSIKESKGVVDFLVNDLHQALDSVSTLLR
jgi:hypothetical protein